MMIGTRIRFDVEIAIGLCLLFGVPASADDWTTYANPRFGTTAEVPLDGLAADPPPENGAGQTWTSADGNGTISVYGSFIVVADTFQGYRQFTLNAAREDGVVISYSAGQGDWFAYSGTKGPDIVYMKAVQSKECSAQIAHHIYLRYPAAQQKRYDSIVTRMAKSLHAGRGVDCN